MHRRLLLLASTLIVMVPCLGFAPSPANAAGEEIAYFFIGPDGKITQNHPTSTTTDTDIFRNDYISGTPVSVAQGGEEWAEDIHGIASGPVANFVSWVTVDIPTPVEPTTWGRIKTQY